MSEMEEKLNAILSNPQMMQQIMSMAQSMSSQPAEAAPKTQEAAASPLAQLDPGMLQKIAGMGAGSGVDKNQRALLNALQPYLSRNRVMKLEKAMRAAKMANLASAFLNSGGLQMLTGR